MAQEISGPSQLISQLTADVKKLGGKRPFHVKLVSPPLLSTLLSFQVKTNLSIKAISESASSTNSVLASWIENRCIYLVFGYNSYLATRKDRGYHTPVTNILKALPLNSVQRTQLVELSISEPRVRHCLFPIVHVD